MRYVALLRAINVGGHTVKMERLRTLFGELGLENIETFIASGNVLFDASARSIAALEKRIERHLHAALGYEVATFVRPVAALKDVLACHPFQRATEDGHALYVGFVASPLTNADRQALAAAETVIDFFHASERELFWLCHSSIRQTKVSMKALEKAIGRPATFRNVTTVRKLAAKA